MEISSSDYLRRALFETLPKHLEPYVRRRLTETYGPGWSLPTSDGQDPSEGLSDLSMQIKLLTTLSHDRTPVLRTDAAFRSRLHEARQARNAVAHGGRMDRYQTLRALGTVRQILTDIGADDGVREVTAFYDAVIDSSWTPPEAQPGSAAPDDAEEIPDDLGPIRLPRRALRADHQDSALRADHQDSAPVKPDPASDDLLTAPAELDPPAVPEPPADQPRNPLDAVALDISFSPTVSYAQAVAGLAAPISVALSLAPAEHDAADNDSRAAGVPDAAHWHLAADEEDSPTEAVHRIVGARGPHQQRVAGMRLTLTVESEGTAITEPWHFGVDLLTDPIQRSSTIRLNRTELLQMTAQAPTTVRLRIEAEGHDREVTVDGPVMLAARQWVLRGSVGDAARTLATFVQPQQPELPALWRRAADHLQAATGRSSLSGYQDSPERVDATVQALCDAIVERDIAYSTPPTNWSDEGQRVRTAEEVLDGRLATCLDTTVLMASALEFVDLQPLIVLLDGHTFLGYWKTENHPAESIVTSGSSLVNLIDRGDIGLAETTALTNTESAPLPALHRAARQAMAPDGSAVLFVLSIREARERGISVLPARGHDESGQAVEITYQPAARPIFADVTPASAPIPDRPRRPKGPPQVEKWKRQLLDLSLRNRLINSPESALRRHSIVRLAIPDGLIGSFEDLVSAETRLSLSPDEGRQDSLDETYLATRLLERHDVATDLPLDEYDSALQKIAADTRTLIEETGANNLFLAVGSLVWRSADRDLRSPLILVPVELQRKSRKSLYTLKLDQTGSSTPNFSLLERLSVDIGLQIPGLEDPETDAAGVDIDKTLDAVRRALIVNGLGFRVEPTVHLGLFKFGGFRLWKDLEESWEQIAGNPLVRHLIETPKAPFVDPNAAEPAADLDDLVARLPIPADSSQAGVVAEALAGRSLVVEGPPGTGKSQTITNLIVRAVADGKRVLFVAEKRAALEVVARRLRAVGMSDLVLNLHDREQRPDAVRDKLRRGLDLSADPDREQIRATASRLSASGDRLRTYRRLLHETGSAGLSYFSAHDRLMAQGAGATLKLSPERLSTLATDQILALRDSLPVLKDALWRQAGDSTGLMGYLHDAVDPDRLPGLLGAVDELREAFGATSPEVARAAHAGSGDQVSLLASVLAEPVMTARALAALAGPQWSRQAAALAAGLADFDRGMPNALAFYRPEVIDGPLDEVRADLVTAKTALFGKVRKSERALAPLAPWATGRPMNGDPQVLLALVDELIGLRHRLGELTRLVNDVLPAMAARWGAIWTPLDPEARAAARSAIDWHRAAAGLVPAPGVSPTPFQQAAAVLVDTPASGDRGRMAGELSRCGAALARLSESSGATVAPEEVLASPPVPGSRETRLEGLSARNELNRGLEPLRRSGMDDAVAQILGRGLRPDDLAPAFERGLAAAALDERGRRASFNRFSPDQQASAVDGYTAATGQIRDELPALLIDQALAHHRPALDAEPSRLGTLRSEVNRRRGRGRTIRSLFTEYGDLISRITPCVLVSPDSAARFIPADRRDFDLVVFDEASQITVASAVGAMGRGRSVVVCGDSHQMPPTSFAQLVRDDEFADEELADEESILGECVAAQVPRHWLSWHYRSRVESLIAFSNQHYYDGKLSSLPSPLPDGRDAGPGGFGILMHRVDGTFHHSYHRGVPRRLVRTNPEEADAIVADIRDRFDASDVAPSVGVVTFNAQQRDLIETRLRDLDDPRITAAMDAPDGAFVKNLENVQGDERDVILFSVAFAADENGNVPLNFGPLNRPGGERRLNVAITRARRQVVMFCSFDPAQLRTERSQSKGLRHLKEYLEVAAEGPEELDAAAERRIDRHTEDIAGALRHAGLSVRTDVGMSDFRIDLVLARPEAPDVPLVAVLLDGPSWNGRATVYDRDVLPTTVLDQMMGWPDVERVWLPEWLNDRDAVVERLRAATFAARPAGTDVLAAATETSTGSAADTDSGADSSEPESAPGVDDGSATQAPAPDSAAAGAPAPDSTASGTASEPSGIRPASNDDHGSDKASETPMDDRWFRPVARGTDPRPPHPVDPRYAQRLIAVTEFQTWSEHRFGEKEILDEANLRLEARGYVERAIEEICAAEFPLRLDRLRFLIGRAFGLQRVKGSRITQIDGLIPRSSCTVDGQGFVWPQGISAETMTGHRRHALSHEGIGVEDLHPVELRNAVAAILDQAGPGVSDEDVIRAALSEIGGKRLTAGIRVPLEEALHQAQG
ncbi:DUF4011 domain-containing protein [Acidipropionibacterium acidipropionici]|uniref:DUF4011 domain-containing protein n=1 Tax=Acidipropionibacterium acidipropionici TaxID=1748 RepID=UPI00040CC134|nr:DUF4011 domain-containing protein [Acidipropionibacterium acidipropionici]ALN14788.1 hypothetical protein ASQ49_05270 [Acidipropionibacterium acidipropionici]APZ09457.1 hypothetical protein BWX38_09650 [Acidipropionibacterium acidipropionici]